MAKKRPFTALILIMVIFALVAFLTIIPSTGITGFFLYERISSIFSKNTLATIGPTAIFIIIFSAATIALKRISKE